MRSAVRLAAGDGFHLDAVTCVDDHRGWSAAELGSGHRLVLVRRGLFRRKADGRAAVIDPTMAYLGVPGEEEHFAHPAGGDVCTSVSLTPELWRTLAGEGPPGRPTLYVDARLDLAHRKVLAAVRGGDTAFELAESLLSLIGAALAQLGPRPAAASSGSGAMLRPGASTAEASVPRTTAPAFAPDSPEAPALGTGATEATTSAPPAPRPGGGEAAASAAPASRPGGGEAAASAAPAPRPGGADVMPVPWPGGGDPDAAGASAVRLSVTEAIADVMPVPWPGGGDPDAAGASAVRLSVTEAIAGVMPGPRSGGADIDVVGASASRTVGAGAGGVGAATRGRGVGEVDAIERRPSPVGRSRGGGVRSGAAITDAAREAIAADHPAAGGLMSLAELLAVSPYQLSRAFTRELGVSLTHYRNRVRVGRALDRLENGEPSLAGLAADLGFADQAHLTRTIRHHVGHTPTALRRLLAPRTP
ncbi:helix-turn-helix domain-containing protein [Nonomuraea jabiensis]|uniref:AraC-like DNA-binding protein n=1 Tax=Nonomuraea jabiensis TaxID=882448 RepID=A0A7W9GBU0_9ACTN|nr:helix-turn-helix domain-containing protein [Nonomuraea jabiensis]MBB5780888.1 AraC-like DNA-binding protein [Nonomuraea jabiensis]